MTDQRYIEGVGRRKRATARVRIVPGSGAFVVNDKAMNEFFVRERDVSALLAPLKLTGTEGQFDISVKVVGGGVGGQAGAVRMGIARALSKWDENLHTMLHRGGLLTRDPREKERKKPGLKRARKAPQYTKR